MSKEIILVDENDQPIGEGDKLAVHRSGQLHRAFSILIYNSKGQMLLQKRARGKYHAGGLWSNACCSHPRSGEDMVQAAQERLQEEMGISCDLEEKYKFHYRVELDSGMIENEIDHILEGRFDGEPKINPREAEDWRWIDLDELKKEIKANPEKFTPWFRMIVEKMGKSS